MSYETFRFKEGLAGSKPGLIVLDPAGHRAQTRGYEQHLANKDLAERMSGISGGSGSGGFGVGVGLVFSLFLCMIFLILGVVFLPFLPSPDSDLPVRPASSRKKGVWTALSATLSFVFFCAAFKAAINPVFLFFSFVFLLFALCIDRNPTKSKPRHE